jgi:hypothetical protein
MSSTRKDADAAQLDKRDSSAVSRRGLLRASTMAVGAAALFTATIAAEQAEAGNMSQKASGYHPTPSDGKRCDGCSLFIAPASCKLVAGEISPAGWCRFYSKKS